MRHKTLSKNLEAMVGGASFDECMEKRQPDQKKRKYLKEYLEREMDMLHQFKFIPRNDHSNQSWMDFMKHAISINFDKVGIIGYVMSDIDTCRFVLENIDDRMYETDYLCKTVYDEALNRLVPENKVEDASVDMVCRIMEGEVISGYRSYLSVNVDSGSPNPISIIDPFFDTPETVVTGRIDLWLNAETLVL